MVFGYERGLNLPLVILMRLLYSFVLEPCRSMLGLLKFAVLSDEVGSQSCSIALAVVECMQTDTVELLWMVLVEPCRSRCQIVIVRK